MNLVLPFTESAATRHDISGGKGANLALLTQRGFPVPPGFIVTATAYREFAASARELIASITRFHHQDATVLRDEAQALRQAIERLPLPAALVSAVTDQLANYPAGQAFSVRSSSTFEDLASAAFAGQHDTYLNIRGTESILHHLRACFASLWQDRAIAYRNQLGFDHQEATMAVVIQTMVPAQVAGVAFSINPVSGAIDEMLVNANFGLGESVVSGDGAIDQFVLSREGVLLNSNIGEKTQRIVVSAQGTEEQHVSIADAMQSSMSAEQLAELGQLLRRVEDSYQFPQDIEWAIGDDRLWLLQSRPVTTIPPRWTRDEAAERFPNVLTPLAWEMVEDGFHRSLNHSFRLMGYPPFSGKWFGMHGHYIYGNQNAVEIYGRRMPLSIRNLAELEAAIPHLRDNYAWVQELPLEWSRDLDHYLLTLGELNAESLEDKSIAEIWDFVERVNRLGADYFLPNIAISLTQRTLYRLFHGLLILVTGNPLEAAGLFDTLIAHTETKTGIVNKELAALAALIRSNEGLQTVVESAPSRTLIDDNRLTPFADFFARFSKFLRDHGHREVDFDPYHATWLEAPWLVLDNLRMMARLPADESAAGKERDVKIRMQEAELALYNRLPENLRFFFHELIRLVRNYTTLDDVEHYHTTRLTLPLRKGLRALGRRLQALGVVDAPMDIFFAHYRPLAAAIAENNAATWKLLGKALREEKAAYLLHRDQTPAWNPQEAETPLSNEDALTGLPGSPGVVEGPVFLVRSPDDFALFPKGAVLVARTTNPAWTPLFYNACAVVTESGGPLSHGAVTAREMQIPAVMSVRGILSRVTNGQRIRVDGRHGRVELL